MTKLGPLILMHAAAESLLPHPSGKTLFQPSVALWWQRPGSGTLPLPNQWPEDHETLGSGTISAQCYHQEGEISLASFNGMLMPATKACLLWDRMRWLPQVAAVNRVAGVNTALCVVMCYLS